MRFEWLSFESEYSADGATIPLRRPLEPRTSETTSPTRGSHVTAAPDRPWLICLHGLGTGGPYADFAGFRAEMLHHELGLNLLMPVLPLHGPRKPPSLPVASLLSFDSTRRVSRRVPGRLGYASPHSVGSRAQGATKVGLYGLSMGSYVCGVACRAWKMSTW